MSADLVLHRGPRFDTEKSEAIRFFPLSFQEVYTSCWVPAMEQNGITPSNTGWVGWYFFSFDDYDRVMEGFQTVYDWAEENAGENKNYVQRRTLELRAVIKGLKLILEAEGADLSEYWFDAG